jgi:hypothetical protein
MVVLERGKVLFLEGLEIEGATACPLSLFVKTELVEVRGVTSPEESGVDETVPQEARGVVELVCAKPGLGVGVFRVSTTRPILGLIFPALFVSGREPIVVVVVKEFRRTSPVGESVPDLLCQRTGSDISKTL